MQKKNEEKQDSLNKVVFYFSATLILLFSIITILFNEQANQLFFNNNYEARATFNFAKVYMFNANYELLDYRASGNNFTQQVNLLNFAFSRFILKNKAGEVKVGINNVLNNNFGASQNASFNFVERSTYNNLGRYWMVSFTYNLNKQLNPMGQRGGMRMMIRQ
jgi:hypothetical protein